MTRLLFYGDPHGNFAPLESALEETRADAVILLGDIGTTDLEADWYDGLFQKPEGPFGRKISRPCGGLVISVSLCLCG